MKVLQELVGGRLAQVLSGGLAALGMVVILAMAKTEMKPRGIIPRQFSKVFSTY